MTHPFRAGVESRDLAAMTAALSPDVTFWSPLTFKPFEGRDAVGTVLGAVLQVFEDFRYVDEMTGDGSLVLVFEARVGDRQVQGVDILRLGADGLVESLTVMVRPLSATLALGEAMGEKLGVERPA